MRYLLALLALPALGVAAWARTRLQDRRHARAALDAVEPSDAHHTAVRDAVHGMWREALAAIPADAELAQPLDPLLPEHVDPLLPLEQLVEVMAAWPQLVSSFYREDHVR